MSWLDSLFTRSYRTVQDEGVALTQRAILDFVGSGVTATDDSTNGRTVVTIAGGGSVPTGTGFFHITGGVADAAAALVVNADVDAAAAIAGTKISPNFGSQTITTTGNVILGTTPATTGNIRVASATQLWVRNTSNSGNFVGVHFGDTYNSLNVGSDDSFANAASYVNIYPSTAVAIGVSGTTHLYVTPSGVAVYGDSDSLTFGNSHVASTGTMRARNAWTFYGRDQANSADVKLIDWNSSNQLLLGESNADLAIGSQKIVSTVDSKGTHYFYEPQHIQTTDATVTTVGSFTIGSNTALTIAVYVTGMKTDASQAAQYGRVAGFRNNAGTVAQVGTTQSSFTLEDDSSWDCTIDNSGTTIRVRVTGKAATTINWTCVITRLDVGL